MKPKILFALFFLIAVSSSHAIDRPVTGAGENASVRYYCSHGGCANSTISIDLEDENSLQQALSIVRPLLGSLAEYIPSEGLRERALYVLENSGWLELPENAGTPLASVQFADASKKINFDLEDEGLGYIIEFSDEPLTAYMTRLKKEGVNGDYAAYSATLAQQHAKAVESIQAAAPQATVRRHYTKVLNGVSVSADKDDLPALASLDSVKKIHPIRRMHALLNDSIPLINADDAWLLNDSHGLNVTGRNKTIGIIDTGVDYTHPDLGSCNNQMINGTPENHALESEHPYNNSFDYNWTITKPGYGRISLHFSRIDVETGYDYVYILDASNNTVARYTGSYSNLWTTPVDGDTVKVRLTSDTIINDWGFEIDQTLDGSAGFAWNCTKVAGGFDYVNNDSDPMDDHGHGTHCAATAAGNGTLAGVAPAATVYAYKVLNSAGSGSTDDIIAAIEAAVDPDGDNDTSDHVDVISMSLGGSGDPNDELSQAVDNAVDAGVVVAVAAGNDGPDNWTISSPGCARKALTVGASYKDNASSGKTLSSLSVVNDSTNLSAIGLQYSNTTPAGGIVGEMLYAGLGYSGNFSSQDFTDKIALILRGEILFSEKVANAHATGAIGVVIFNNEQGNFYGTLQNTSAIPAASVSKEDGTYILGLIEANTTYANLTVTPDYMMIAEFSSRGPSYIYNKPDVIAPGVLICAAQYSTYQNESQCYDDNHIMISGTSMATPHVAGAAALILQAHPDWSPLEVKAALENTVRDLGLARNEQGAGLIDAHAAVSLSRPPPVALITDLEDVAYG